MGLDKYTVCLYVLWHAVNALWHVRWLFEYYTLSKIFRYCLWLAAKFWMQTLYFQQTDSLLGYKITNTWKELYGVWTEANKDPRPKIMHFKDS